MSLQWKIIQFVCYVIVYYVIIVIICVLCYYIKLFCSVQHYFVTSYVILERFEIQNDCISALFECRFFLFIYHL